MSARTRREVSARHLVPVRVALDAALLPDHAGVVLEVIEGEAARVEAHVECLLVVYGYRLDFLMTVEISRISPTLGLVNQCNV